MQPDDPRKRSDKLESLIASYLEAEKSGESFDRDALIEQNPDLAESLCEFFANHDQMKAAADLDTPTLPPKASSSAGDEPTLAPSTSSVDTPTLAPNAEPTETPKVVEKVRYFGDYELLEEIARGGMGVVYKAKQVNLNRIVALKMILAGQFAGQEDVKRFYTEAEAAANLDHSGIVPIFEIGEHDGQHYFSMGYIEGDSLAQKVADGPLPPREAAELVKKICDAMAYAHERGVIHRDLKPANILIDSTGQPKVTDFGLAKKTEADSGLTGTGQILGTPAYMPPEQASGKTEDVGPLADVYSLGAILYCTLIGRPPFQSANPMDTLLQVLEKDPVPPRQLDPQIDKDIETVCLKCLAKERLHRYPSAQELADDLERFLNDEPILARPPSPWERASRWARQHVVTVTTIMLLLVTSTTILPFARFDAALDASMDAAKTQRSTSSVIAEMERLILEDPEHAAAHYELAQAYFDQQDYDDVIRELSLAIQLDDQDWNYLHLRGSVRVRKQQYRDAIDDLTRALELNPVSAETLLQRAHARFGLRKFDLSLEDVNRAIAMRPAVADAYRLRGKIYSQQPDAAKSNQDLNIARRLERN